MSGRSSGGKKPRDKGNRAERAIVRFFQDRGFAAERVPLSGCKIACNNDPLRGGLRVQ